MMASHKHLQLALSQSVLMVIIGWMTCGVALSQSNVCSTATSPTYYVSPSGNDSNSGKTLAQAFLTISHAVNIATPGNLIQIEPGSYSAFTIWNEDGTASQPIVLRGDPAYPRNQVVVNGGIWITGTYWNICHFRQTNNTSGMGISGENESYVTVDDVEADHNQQNGYRVYGPSDHTTLSNSYIHDNVLENVNGSGSHFDEGVALEDTTTSVIRNNLVENNWGEGIDVMHDTNATLDVGLTEPMNNVVQGNVVHNAWAQGIYNDAASGTFISGNLVYFDNSAYQPSQNNGIIIADENVVGEGATNVVIENNIVYGAMAGLRYGSYLGDRGLHYATIAGNTCINSTSAGVWIDNAPTTTGNVITDNIFLSSAGSAANVPNAAGLTFSYNAWYGVTSGKQTGTGDVLTDPQLAGESGGVFVSSNDSSRSAYVPAKTSPVVGKGSYAPLLGTDFFTSQRPSPLSIGAIEITTP